MLPLDYVVREKIPDIYKVVALDLADFALTMVSGWNAQLIGVIATLKSLSGFLILKDRKVAAWGQSDNFLAASLRYSYPFYIVPAFTITWVAFNMSEVHKYIQSDDSSGRRR